MNNTPGNCSPLKNTISKARKELNSSPLKLRERRKSSIPLQLVEFINQMKPDSASKKSYKGDCSNKRNHLRKMINTSIPEESENSSIKENKNKKEKKEKKVKKIKSEKREKIDKNEKSERKGKKDKKNEIENNNYYIHYIKNVYENEPHLNKDNLFKSANKNVNETLINFLESNKNIKPVFKRRNSAMNRDLFKSNLMNKNLFLDKIQINSKLPESIINKKKSGDVLLHKKKDLKEKDNTKSHNNNNNGNKNKSKNKNKDKKKYKEKNKTKDKDKDKDKNKDSNEENNINTENQKKNIKEKEILENEKKTETENNIEHTKIKKINKFKKFLCCFINNGDDSIEND